MSWSRHLLGCRWDLLGPRLLSEGATLDGAYIETGDSKVSFCVLNHTNRGMEQYVEIYFLAAAYWERCAPRYGLLDSA